MTAEAVPGAVWEPAPGAAVRGSLVFLPGRGEPASVYARFGRRLAADGYVVHVREFGAHPDAVAAAFADAARNLPGPVVLGGADAGALTVAAAVAHSGAQPAGLLLAGVPTEHTGAAPADWDSELAARTACPAHRGVLTTDAGFVRGALAHPVPDELPAVGKVLAQGDPPVLLLHGDADPVAPIAEIHRLAADAPGTTLVGVADGRHDVLNDAAHRSVAAQVVQWLERLRGGPGHPRVLTVHEASS